jgi:glycosyltransferase involved in cell wall biosynthesis
MASLPAVSVVIPTRNRPELLRNALLSVLHQTEPDFEVLVVDDDAEHGSADGVVKALGDPRIHYVRQPEHRGVTAARNVGVAWASAPFIAFLDDDDEWLPEKLSVQLQALQSSPPEVAGVYSARLTVYRESGEVATQRFPEPFSPFRGNVITTSSLLIRRSCFDAVGTFDEELTAGEDWDMWVRIGSRFRFLYMDQVLIRYSVHAASTSWYAPRHVRSREIILLKHAEVFGRHPRSFAGRYKRLGVDYYRHGEVEKARRALLKAIRIWPFSLGAYWALCRSCLASRRSRRRLLTV